MRPSFCQARDWVHPAPGTALGADGAPCWGGAGGDSHLGPHFCALSPCSAASTEEKSALSFGRVLGRTRRGKGAPRVGGFGKILPLLGLWDEDEGFGDSRAQPGDEAAARWSVCCAHGGLPAPIPLPRGQSRAPQGWDRAGATGVMGRGQCRGHPIPSHPIPSPQERIPRCMGGVLSFPICPRSPRPTWQDFAVPWGMVY